MVQNDSPFVTIEAAAEYLLCSERTIRRLIADGSLPAYRLGKRAVRIKTDELMALVRPVNAGEVL